MNLIVCYINTDQNLVGSSTMQQGKQSTVPTTYIQMDAIQRYISYNLVQGAQDAPSPNMQLASQ